MSGYAERLLASTKVEPPHALDGIRRACAEARAARFSKEEERKVADALEALGFATIDPSDARGICDYALDRMYGDIWVVSRDGVTCVDVKATANGFVSLDSINGFDGHVYLFCTRCVDLARSYAVTASAAKRHAAEAVAAGRTAVGARSGRDGVEFAPGMSPEYFERLGGVTYSEWTGAGCPPSW